MLVFRYLAFSVISAVALLGQKFQLGVQGGVPFGDFFLPGGYRYHFGIADYTSKPVPYTLGAIGEFGFSSRLSIETSALYERFHYSYSGYGGGSTVSYFTAKTTGNAWSFPILLKWRPLRKHPVFLVGGPVMRHLGSLNQVADYRTIGVGAPDALSTSSTSNPADLRKRWYPGLELGGGWSFHFSKVRISPEIRYTRWTANIADDRDVFSLRRPLQFPPNRIELLVGITYGM